MHILVGSFISVCSAQHRRHVDLSPKAASPPPGPSAADASLRGARVPILCTTSIGCPKSELSNCPITGTITGDFRYDSATNTVTNFMFDLPITLPDPSTLMVPGADARYDPSGDSLDGEAKWQP
jgi:hypothetical protein